MTLYLGWAGVMDLSAIGFDPPSAGPSKSRALARANQVYARALLREIDAIQTESLSRGGSALTLAEVATFTSPTVPAATSARFAPNSNTGFRLRGSFAVAVWLPRDPALGGGLTTQRHDVDPAAARDQWIAVAWSRSDDPYQNACFMVRGEASADGGVLLEARDANRRYVGAYGRSCPMGFRVDGGWRRQLRAPRGADVDPLRVNGSGPRTLRREEVRGPKSAARSRV